MSNIFSRFLPQKPQVMGADEANLIMNEVVSNRVGYLRDHNGPYDYEAPFLIVMGDVDGEHEDGGKVRKAANVVFSDFQDKEKAMILMGAAVQKGASKDLGRLSGMVFIAEAKVTKINEGNKPKRGKAKAGLDELVDVKVDIMDCISVIFRTTEGLTGLCNIPFGRGEDGSLDRVGIPESFPVGEAENKVDTLLVGFLDGYNYAKNHSISEVRSHFNIPPDLQAGQRHI
jgi:hypothetical protein